jgi:natural product biosynthesis luciferase-like monooxygenase protein
MFFSHETSDASDDGYHLLLEATRFAETHDFKAIWVPERHFDLFGGIFPNPALLCAALAMITKRIELRAGSLVSPLHDTLRIAEDWAVLDNLSGGRVAISFGSGWNVNDFVFFPERYQNRQAFMYEQIEQVRSLWRGHPEPRQNSYAKELKIQTYPLPSRPDIPIWITSSGNEATFESAGRIGAHLLTHLLGQDQNKLAAKIQFYRDSRKQAGFDPEAGRVCLMLHTYLGTDAKAVELTVRRPFRRYLRSAVALENEAARGGGQISGGKRGVAQEMSDDLMEELLDLKYERYYDNASLLGTPESRKPLIRQLESIGVNEIACLIDFGVQTGKVLDSLVVLDEFRRSLLDSEEEITK